MATSQSTVDFLLDQLSPQLGVTARKMFGEYALYCQGKVVALVCDDELFVKPTEPGAKINSEINEKPPYPGAKMYWWIAGEKWDEGEWLSELILATAKALPLPKPKNLVSKSL